MAAKGREDGSRRSPRGSPQRRGGATFAGLPGTSTYIDSGPGASGFIKGSVARLSRPLPGVQELTEGRTDFFAELARSVGSEIQRLVRYTLMGYTTPLTEEVEMRAQADIDNGLSRILELLAAYVDDVAVASQELWPKLDAASLGEHMLSRQLDEAVAQAQRLEEELEKKEKDIRKSSLLMRQMRAFYTSDLENQRDRFRTTLLNSLPELTDSAMAGIMDHLASVNMFDPKDFVDVETASLLQLHRATMEKDFALEREALGSRIQKETEARINYERLYQAENAKVQWLTSGIEKLKANGIVAVEALAAPVDGALHPPTMPGIDAPQDGTLSIDVLDSPSLQDRNTSGLRREMMKAQQDIAEMKRRESVIAHVVGDLNDLVNRQFDMANEYHGSKEHDLIASVIGEFPAKVGEIQMVLAGKLSDDGRGSASPVSPSSAREEASPEAKISQLQIQTKVLKTEKEVLKLHLQDAREKLAAAEHAAGTHHTSAAPAVPGREEPSSAHEALEVVQEQEAEVEAKPSEPKKSATKLSEELVRHPSFDEDNLRDARASLASPAPSTRRFSRRSFAAVSELGGEAELQTFEALPPQTRKRSSIKARPLLADVGAQTEEPADIAATKYPPVPLEPSLPPAPQDERSETDDAAGAEDEEAAAPRLATQGSQTGEDDARDPSGPHNTQLEFQLVEHFSSRRCRSPTGRSLTAGRIAIGAEDDLHVDVSPSSRPTRRERRTFASGSQSPRGAASPWAGEAAALPLVPEVVSRGTSPIVLSRGTSPESSGGGELSGEEPATLRVDPQPAGSTASSLQAPRQAHGLVPTPRGSRAASRTPRASKTVPLELEEDGSAALQGFVVSRAVEERRLPRMTRQNGDFPPSGPPQDDEPPTPSVGVSAPTEPPPPGPAEPPPRTSSPAALPAGLAALGAPEPPPSPRLEPHLAEASPAPRSPSAQQRESSEQGTEGSSAEEGGEEEEEEEEASAAVDAWEEEGSWPGAAEAAVHDGEPEPTREQLEEELEDVRDNLREAVFERDYLHAQLGLAREAAVQAKSEHSQLWRRQSAWLGKCKRVLEGADVGLRLPIPAALLEPQCPPDALEEVFRAELAGDGQLVDEDELQHRLKKSGEKALVAAYVEAATAAEGQRRQAAAMAESLAPFRELAMTSRRTSLRPAHQQPSMAASPRSQASQRSQDDLGGGASPRRGTAPNLIPVGDDDAQDRTPRRGTASAVLMRVGARKSTRFMQATETDFVRPMESLAERTAAQYAAQRFVGRASQESSFVRTATARNSQASFDASLAGLDEQLVQDAAAACDYLDYVDKRWSWHPAPELGSRTPEHSDASSGSPPGSRTLSGWARQLDQLEATMPPVLGLDSDTGDASDRRSSHGFSGAWQREGASQMLGRSASAPACAAEDVSLCHVCVRRLRRRTPAAGGPGAAPPEAEAALELARPGAEDPHDLWPSRAASQQAGTSPLAASQQTFAAGTLKAVEDAASTLGGLSAITTAAFTERPVTAATGERATTASTIDAFRAGTADTVRQSADQHLAEEASSGLGDPSDGQESALDLQLAPVQRGTPPGTPVQVKPPSPLGGPSSPLAPLHDAPLLEPEPEMDSPEPEALCAHCGRCLGPLPAPVEADPSPPPAALARSPARTPEDRRPAAGSVPAPESAEDGASPSPYAEGRAPAPQPAPASGDGGPAAPLAQPPAAPLAQSLFGEATPSAAHPPRTTMVDAKQQSKTRPPNPPPPPLPAAGSAHCDRKPSRLLGKATDTESEAMEKPRALTEAGAQTIPRPLVEQGAQTYISRIADLLEEGADTSKVVGTQTDSPDVMQVEISKRLAWARAQRQETLHQILGTGGASGGHVEYPRESAEADQLVVELAKLGMDRRALKSLVEPIEVVDVAVQSGVEVAGSLDPIFRWLKLNLLQRQNAWLYCLPSEVSALEGFPNIPGARLEKLLVDFERFLEEILSRPLPAKSAARSALRARYRARSDSPCSRRNRSGSPPPGRGSLLGGRESWRRSNAVEPYEYPVGFLSSGFDGEQEVGNMVLVPDTTAPPPIGKGLCRGRAENAPIQSPWRWERSGDAANPWGFPMFASPEAPPDQPPKKAKVPRTVEEVLGVPLPPSAFAAKPGAAGLDPDPLCLAWAAENGLILPAGAQKLFPPDVPYPTRAAKALAAVPEIYRPTMRPPPAKAQLQFVQFDGAASKLQTHEFVGRKVGDMANSNPTPFGKLQVRESVGRKAGDMSISNSVSKVGDMSDTGRTTAPAQTPRNPASSPLSSPLDATGRGPEELLPGGGDDRTGRLRELLDVLRRAAARSLLEGLRPLRAPAVQLQAPAAQPSRAGPAGARPVRSLGPTRPAPAAALAAPPGSARRPAQQAAAPSPLPRRQPASGQAAASEQPRAPEAPASARGASRRLGAREEAPTLPRAADLEEMAAKMPVDGGSAPYVGCVAWSYGAGTAGADSDVPPADTSAAEAPEQDRALATESMDSSAHRAADAVAGGHRPDPANLPRLSAWRKLDAPLQASPADMAVGGWLPRLRPDIQDADAALPQPTPPRPVSRGSSGRPGSRSSRRAMTPKEEWQRWSGGGAPA